MTRAPLRLALVAILTDSPSNPTDGIPDGELIAVDYTNVHCRECAEQLAQGARTWANHLAATLDHD